MEENTESSAASRIEIRFLSLLLEFLSSPILAGWKDLGYERALLSGDEVNRSGHAGLHPNLREAQRC